MENSYSSNISMHTLTQNQKHPCYSVEIHHQTACVHLLVPQNCKYNFNHCLTDIGYLVNHGLLVNVNIIQDKGVNDQYISEMVEKVGKLGVSIINIIPFVDGMDTRNLNIR